MGKKTEIVVGKTKLTVSNLEKVLYPDVGFTKGQVIDYYIRIAPVLLPHLRNREWVFLLRETMSLAPSIVDRDHGGAFSPQGREDRLLHDERSARPRLGSEPCRSGTTHISPSSTGDHQTHCAGV